MASIVLLPGFGSPMLPPSFDLLQISTTLQKISVISGAEIAFSANKFEMHGLIGEVRLAIQLIAESDIVKVHFSPCL